MSTSKTKGEQDDEPVTQQNASPEEAKAKNWQRKGKKWQTPADPVNTGRQTIQSIKNAQRK
jgi:hypothetical protein